MTGVKFPTKHDSPMAENYHPEEDETPLLDSAQASMYRAFIGSANWEVNLGRFNTLYAVYSMESYSAAPREG